MATYYLAVDIGASSGRHILGHMENGKMILEEIYRFENGMVKKDGELCWEFDRLFTELVNGLKKCKEIGKIPVSMGVDTWVRQLCPDAYPKKKIFPPFCVHTIIN